MFAGKAHSSSSSHINVTANNYWCFFSSNSIQCFTRMRRCSSKESIEELDGGGLIRSHFEVYGPN